MRRATVFVDGKKVVSLPLEVLPVNSDQLFGKQILGYGTNGVFVDMPYYLDATTHTMDTVSLRRPERRTRVGSDRREQQPVQRGL